MLTDTGEPIPADYKDNKGGYKAQGFAAQKKDDGTWGWFKKEFGENPDIPDQWNTCLKMAKKRAHGDAIQSSTAASDMFEGFAISPSEVINGEYTETPNTQGNTSQQNSQPRSQQQSNGGASVPQIQLPNCPKCGSEMWDNRNGDRHAPDKNGKQAPDFRCKDSNCKWNQDREGNWTQGQWTTVIWRIEYPDDQQGPGKDAGF